MAGEHHAISAIQLNRACEHHSLDISPDFCQVLGILRMSDACDVLLDDRAFVELC